MKKEEKMTGFTLAETLIVIAIIGVISVLTLPNVMGNYKKKTYVAQLQKVYNQISQAAQQFMVDEEADSLVDTSLTTDDGVKNFLKKYFKVVKTCDDNYSECMGATYKSLDLSASSSVDDLGMSGSYCAVLNTGATICMYPMDDWYKKNYPKKHDRSWMLVDVNGKNGPNVNGRDLFQFELYSDGKIANAYEKEKGDDCQLLKSSAGYGGSCFSKVLEDSWKMDY